MGAATDLKLWVGILAGPAAWFAQLGVAYPVAQLTCHAGFAPQHPGTLHGVSIAALVTIALAAFPSWQLARRDNATRVQFMARLGLLTCALFAAVVIANWVPVFIINNCEA